MSERGIQLLREADSQICELIGLVTARGQAILSRACPGREKLGDGTVAASALHTADNYLPTAGFLQSASQMPSPRAGAAHGRHQMPRFLLALGHAPRGHAKARHDEGTHGGDYTAENVNLDGLVQRLSAGRDTLSLLADMTDEQLDTIPPAGGFRFCDGQRTLEQVIASVLKHQSHQIDAIRSALA